MYQMWLKEREEESEKKKELYKEIGILLDEINELKKKLTNEIESSTKNREEKLRLWCTKCDVDLIDKGIALDCPNDGVFYECPSCNYKIVIFKKRG